MHILIVEDKRDLAEMLRRAFVERNDSAVIALNGVEGLRHAEMGAFDAIVLDLMLPAMEGPEIVRRLREDGMRTPILVLTAKDTVRDTVNLLDLGADDYLTKPFAMAEFMARLRALVRRGPTDRGTNLVVADLVLDVAAGQVSRGGDRLSLTRTEYRILECLMRRPHHVVTRSAIIERIWGDEAEVEANTLDAFMKTLRAKVDHNRAPKLIHTIRGVGYRLHTGEI